MTVSRRASARTATKRPSARGARPHVEGLEGRILLYSAVGQWTYSSRITYSFMPDGTSIGGTPSVLFQKLNTIAPTGTWQQQIEQAATPWEANANLNLALVSDDGTAVGSNGDQQDDPRFGDIRIGAMSLPSGVLAETFLPPPSNGGTAAGDIVFNSNINWQIGGGYDLETVALHEFGHALGLGDQSTDIYSAMYYSYDGLKTSLDSDDIAGIQSLYGAPQYDRFNTGVMKNFAPTTATNIMPYMDGNDQIALSGLDNTVATQSEYYAVTVPSGGSGQMVVTEQSAALSSLVPGLYVFNSSMQMVTSVTAPGFYGATVQATLSVTPGQVYYIKVASVNGVYGRVGSYGLEVNFGSQYQPPISPPNTMVPQQPDGSGGGSMDDLLAGGAGGPAAATGIQWATMGGLAGWSVPLDAPPPGTTSAGDPGSAPAAPSGGPAGAIVAAATPTAPAGTVAVPGAAGPQGPGIGANPTATPAVAPSPSTSTDLVLQAVEILLSEAGLPNDQRSGTDATTPLAGTS